MLDELQALCGFPITVTQGSPSTSDPTSAGTHAGQGVFDAVGADLDVMVVNGRKIGFAIWHRTPAQGFPPHVHGVAVGEPLLSSQAATQVQAYFAGRNGLASNAPDDGPRTWVGVTWETYTGGTYVPPTGGDPVRMWNQYPGDRSGTYVYFPEGILAGTPTTTPTRATFNFYAEDAGGGGETLSMAAGDSLMLAARADFQYGQPLDLAAGYWLLRTSGTGTLQLADAYDEGFVYPDVTPSWTTRAEVGNDSTGLRYFAFDPTMLDGSHLYLDGEPLIRLTCTAGTVDLTFVGFQVQTGSGFWVPDGEAEWSANVAPNNRVMAFPGFDDTYDITAGGGGVETNTWTIDGTLVSQFDPQPGSEIDTFGRQVGAETSLISPDDAVDQRDANITTIGGGSQGTSSWSLQYDDGLSFFVDPESWGSTLDETPISWTSPTMAELPTSPSDIPGIGWRRTSTYEWLDDDTGILGWVVGPTSVPDSRYIQISGDAQTAYLFAQTFSGLVDPTTFDHHTGTQIASWIKDVDEDLNVGGPYDGVQGTFDAFEITTNDTLLILTTDSTIRETTDLRHTYPSGGTIGSIEGYTAGIVTIINIPVAPRFRVPGYRYEQPSFVQAPTFVPVIDFDEDPVVTWLRNRQRNDGLGGWSTPRAKGTSSRQLSLHNRGYE
jgi:hypothetical protein